MTRIETPFAAVLLAGGKSRRMGRDKALLKLSDGRALWEHQREVLSKLEPAEWFISGSWREGFPDGLPWLADGVPGRGPLAGITAALNKMSSPRLVVLAVDLPAMTAAFLHTLLQESGGAGAVPQWPDGFFEPLAAVYPKSAAGAAVAALSSEALALQPFVRALVASGSVKARPITEGESGLFTNWNHPDDLSS